MSVDPADKLQVPTPMTEHDVIEYLARHNASFTWDNALIIHVKGHQVRMLLNRENPDLFKTNLAIAISELERKLAGG